MNYIFTCYTSGERYVELEKFNNDCIRELSLFKQLPQKLFIDVANTVEEYRHLTFRVKSLVDYMLIIRMLNSKENFDYYNDNLVYRGMADYRWKLESSLERYQYDEDSEHQLVNEFLTVRPEAFDGLTSNFDILAKMQHYGLPTRLLDFSLNPLVALYFACENMDNVDGRVICGNAELIHNKSEIVEAICSIYKYQYIDDMTLEDYLKKTHISPYEYMSTIYGPKDNRLLFAKPKYWNQRIINQSAVFLVFPNSLNDKLGTIVALKDYFRIDDIIGFDGSEKMQQQIKAIAEQEGCDIYPIEGYSKHIPERKYVVTHDTFLNIESKYQMENIITDHFDYTELGRLYFGHRFTVDGTSFDSVDEGMMKNLLCSIIVDKKFKRTILDELASIGIDQAFIYPELEYTARKIAKTLAERNARY